MPNVPVVGYVDYVLRGDDGKPLGALRTWMDMRPRPTTSRLPGRGRRIPAQASSHHDPLGPVIEEKRDSDCVSRVPTRAEANVLLQLDHIAAPGDFVVGL